METPSRESVFLGSSPAACAVRRAITGAASVDSPVLILGESGVGKELVAREIHAQSRRACRPFVIVNCSAIPETLVETEFFGHVAGAFTDARTCRRGAFEVAHGGVLFLDEVGDLSRVAQPKLLRAIETGEFRPVGSERARQVDLRIVAATNQDLASMRRVGGFRPDLYYRLDVLEILVPPLRERADDIPELAVHLIESISRRNRQQSRKIAPEAVQILRAHSWPGNVRELRSVLERALAMHPDTELDSDCLTLEHAGNPGLTMRRLFHSDWQTAHYEFEVAYMRDLLNRHSQNVPSAARAARLSPRGVYKILNRLGIKAGEESPDGVDSPA
jgi:DNA-binding NtrC family response regulator